MNQKVNELIPTAIEAIKKYLVSPEGSLKVASEYKGYIASLGPSIIQSGLLPALAFYSKSSDRTQADRTLVIKAITEIIGLDAENDSLLAIAIGKDQTEQNELEDKVMNAIIALKLALRTFLTT